MEEQELEAVPTENYEEKCAFLETQIVYLEKQVDDLQEQQKNNEISIRLECMRMALNFKPMPSYNTGLGQSHSAEYTAEKLIKDADTIYNSLLKTK